MFFLVSWHNISLADKSLVLGEVLTPPIVKRRLSGSSRIQLLVLLLIHTFSVLSYGKKALRANLTTNFGFAFRSGWVDGDKCCNGDRNAFEFSSKTKAGWDPRQEKLSCFFCHLRIQLLVYQCATPPPPPPRCPFPLHASSCLPCSNSSIY